MISNLELTSPVIRGQATQGSFAVSDPDGLGGLELSGRVEGAASSPIPFAEPSLSDDDTEASLAFIMLLSNAAPIGRYTLIIEATDVDDLVSDEATVDFDVE